MNIDKVTLKDLSIADGEMSIFTLLNDCHIQEGAVLLKHKLLNPCKSLEEVEKVQEGVRFWMKHLDDFEFKITNGTIVMIQQFRESTQFMETLPNSLSLSINTFIKSLVSKDQLTYVKFICEQMSDFAKDSVAFEQLFEKYGVPAVFAKDFEILKEANQEKIVQRLATMSEKPSTSSMIQMMHDAKRYLKHILGKLIQVFAHIDAVRTMARQTMQRNWIMPEVIAKEAECMVAEGLYHPLLEQPIAYDIKMDAEQPFLLMTGANMSGKSTFMRSLGVAALLAHVGMSVPAKAFKISFLQGLVSNIQVEDNIFLGESYFFAEVQRMKLTAEKIKQQQYNLVIMDEIFKGTNVHDAYDCSKAVINGLLTKQNNLIVLSTHLHELHAAYSNNPKINFKYLETIIKADSTFHFTYKLKDGVSQDRIGFALLQQEGVIDLLK